MGLRDKRQKEFQAVQRGLGLPPGGWEFLDGKDGVEADGLEDHIQKRIHDLICGGGGGGGGGDGNNNDNGKTSTTTTTWDQIITHGPEGEYGHPQHQQVHDVVLATVQECIGSFDKLFVFNPTVVPWKSKTYRRVVFSPYKSSLASFYYSQRFVLFDTFGNWKEKIVPISEYNYRNASYYCEENIDPKNTGAARQCRLRQMIAAPNNNLEEDSLTAPLPELISTEKWVELLTAWQQSRQSTGDTKMKTSDSQSETS